MSGQPSRNACQVVPHDAAPTPVQAAGPRGSHRRRTHTTANTMLRPLLRWKLRAKVMLTARGERLVRRGQILFELRFCVFWGQ